MARWHDMCRGQHEPAESILEGKFSAEHLSCYRLKTHYNLRFWHLVPDFSNWVLGHCIINQSQIYETMLWHLFPDCSEVEVVPAHHMLLDVTSGIQYSSKSESPNYYNGIFSKALHGTNYLNDSPLIEHYKYINTNTSLQHFDGYTSPQVQ